MLRLGYIIPSHILFMFNKRFYFNMKSCHFLAYLIHPKYCGKYLNDNEVGGT